MKKINFQKPKYIIPIILLPFILLFYFIIGNWHGKNKNLAIAIEDSSQSQINDNMPGVSKEIAGQSLKNKLEAYREQFKGQKDFSAIGDMEADSSLTDSTLQSNYTLEEQLRLSQKKKMDSLEAILKESQIGMQKKLDEFSNPKRRNKPYSNEDSRNDKFLEHLKKVAAGDFEKPTPAKSNYEEDMKTFREQMSMVDSMSKAHQSETEKPAKKN